MSAAQLRSGATVYGADGALLQLEKEIGRGGEGSVWSIQGDPQVLLSFITKEWLRSTFASWK